MSVPSEASFTPTSVPTHSRPARRSRAELTDALLAELAGCTDTCRREDIRRELVALNMPVAEAVASRYRNRGVESEDLRQVAYLALVKAAQRFDPEAGHAFLSFTVPTIRGEVRRYFRDHGWMVRPPRRIQELQAQVSRAHSDLCLARGHTPTVEEIATHLGKDADDVREAMDGRGCFSPTSLDQQVGDGSGALGDLIPRPITGHESEGAVDARIALAPIIAALCERDRWILRMRFVDGLTQREMAERIGTSQMHVSRLIARILRDLRKQLGPLEEHAHAT